MQEEDAVQHGTRQSASNGQYSTGQSTNTDQYSTGQSTPNRASVTEAAQVLGVTVDAIRKRVQRGTIPHQRDDAGRVWVLLEAAKSMQGTPTSTGRDESEHVHDTDQDMYQTEGQSHLVESLEDQVGYLRGVIETRDKELEARTEELRRKDHIIAALTERIPELEPPASTEQRDVPNTAPAPQADAGTSSDDESSQEPSEQRSWLYRFFFGP